MMRVGLKIDTWERAVAELGKKNAIKAGVRTVNRTASNARTALVKIVAADMALKSKTVRDKIEIVTAKPTGQAPKAVLYADATRVPLIDFNAKGPYPSRGRGKGVRAKLPSGAGVYPNAFIAKMKSGHVGVYQRTGKARLKIYELRGPSIAQSCQKNSAAAEARAAEMLAKNWEAERKWILEQARQAAGR